MIEQLKNIDTAFKHVRLFTAVLIIASFGTSAYFMWLCLSKITQAQEKIYVITGDKVLQATASNRKDNIPVEIRDHIKMFHENFFTLSPDEKAIEGSIKKSLYLADNSAKEQYDDLKEKGFYAGVISGNVSQQVICDSISLQLNNHPYLFRYFGKQIITRSTAVITRNLITEGRIRELGERTDNNPHGFLIEKWQTIDNSTSNTSKR